MASTLRKSYALIILLQTCIVMLNFCFVECQYGFCAGYGGSCWGGHGKRNNIQDIPTMRILAAKTLLNKSPQNDIAPSAKTQWILSRLITGPMLPNKYHIRWGDFPKDKSYILPKWDHDTASMTDESIESIRIPEVNNNENENNERKISNPQGTMRNLNEKFENNPEIFLISPGEYDKPINDPQKLATFKFLNE